MTKAKLVNIGNSIIQVNIDYAITVNHHPHVYTDHVKNKRFYIKISMYKSVYDKFLKESPINIKDFCKLLDSDISRIFAERQCEFSAYLPKQCIILNRIEYNNNFIHIISYKMTNKYNLTYNNKD